MSEALVLNRNFAAIHVADWQKSMSLIYQGVAEAVDEDLRTYNFADWCELSKTMESSPSGFIHTATLKIAVPEVIRLVKYDRLPERDVKFTRRNLFEHYNYTCFAAGTLILMADGSQRTIESLKSGDKVIDAYGNPQTIIATGMRKSSVVEIKVRGSNVKTVLTPDHPVLDSEGKFVPISSSPEYLVFPRIVNIERKNTYFNFAEWVSFRFKSHKTHVYNGRIYYNAQRLTNGMPCTWKPSPGLAYLLGLYVAEGSSTGNNVILSFNYKEKDTLAKKAVELYEKELGLAARIYAYPKVNPHSAIVYLCNKLLSMFLLEYVGKGAKNKKIPHMLIGKYTKEFLQGLLHGDGSIDPARRKITLCMNGKSAVWDAQSLFWAHGIYPTVQGRTPKFYPGIKSRQPIPGLFMQAENYSRTSSVILDMPAENGEIIYGNSKFVYRKLQFMRPLRDKITVYNIEVGGSSSYIANGLSVHNCCYCGYRGNKKNNKDLNLDHVIPRAKGGLTTWNNIAVSCIPCNTRKADHTPEEAGMRLLVKPSRPKWKGSHSIVQFNIPLKIKQSWQKLIDKVYWDEELKHD